MKNRRWPSVLLGLVVSVVALGYLLRRDLSGVRDELAAANYLAVIPTVALTVLGLWMRSERWRVLLDYRLGHADSFHILNISYFLNGVLPLRIGELGRAALATRVDPPVSVLTSLSSVVVERLLDTLAVFILVGLTLLSLPTDLEIGLMGLAMGALAVIGVIMLAIFAAHPAWAHTLLETLGRVIPLLRRPTFHGWLDQLLDGIKPLSSWRSMALVAGWSGVSWLSSVVAGYIMLFAVFDEPTLVASMAMVSLASFVIAVPAVPGNLGPFEAAVAFGLAGVGLVDEPSAAPAVAFAILLHVVNLLTYIGVGLVGLWVQDVNPGELTRTARSLRRMVDRDTPATAETTGSALGIAGDSEESAGASTLR